MMEWHNPMYKFRDTVKNDSQKTWIPTSALNYDGKFIENYIEGYQTLYVEGREMVSLEIESEAVSIGVRISSQRLPERILTIHFKLEEKNPIEFQRSFNKLMRLLYRDKDVEIHFNDELDMYYYGRYQTCDNIPGNVHSVISSFSIICSDPRKYTRIFETNGIVSEYLPYEVAPISISLKANNDGNLRITNGRQNISVTNSMIKKGDFIEMDIAEGKVFVNGVNKTTILDLTSSFKNFMVRTGDLIKCDNGTPLIRYRGVWL
ncbi:MULTISPECIES: distal tail protein Dit [Bacilli]|nr:MULTISPECIES: distal tail protein Dit [Bacilli]